MQGEARGAAGDVVGGGRRGAAFARQPGSVTVARVTRCSWFGCWRWTGALREGIRYQGSGDSGIGRRRVRRE